MTFLTPSRAKQLYSLFANCSSDEFAYSWEKWFDELASFVDNVSPLTNKSAVFLLETFFSTSQQFPAVSRDLSTRHVPGLLQKICIFDDEDNVCNNMLPFLKLLLSYYPLVLTKHAKAVRSGLCKFTDRGCRSRDLAAQCFALLPNSVGASREIRTENWANQFNAILVEVHKNLHSLYNVLVAVDKTSTKLCKFKLQHSANSSLLNPSNENGNAENLHNRLDFYVACLSHMTRYPFRYPVSIPVGSVVELFHCFNTVLSNVNFRTSTLPIEKSFLNFFVAMPTLVGFTFSLYATDVFDLLLTSLHTMSRGDSVDANKNDHSCLVYEILDRIVARCGAACKFQSHLAKFWQYMKRDLLLLGSGVSCKAAQPTFRFHSEKRKNKGKRKHRRDDLDFALDTDRSVAMATDVDPLANRFRSCCKVLTTICQRLGVTLKPALYRELQTSTCRLALNTQLSSIGSMQIFRRAECRLSLYQLLSAAIACQHPSCPPAIQVGLAIFQRGCRDSDLTVTNFCRSRMQILSCITKPMVPFLENAKSLEDTNRPIVDEYGDNDRAESEEAGVAAVAMATNGSAYDESRDAVYIATSEDEIVVNIDSESDDDTNFARKQYDELVSIATNGPSVTMETPKSLSVAKRFKPDVSSSFIVSNVRGEKFATEMSTTDHSLGEKINLMLADFTDHPADDI